MKVYGVDSSTLLTTANKIREENSVSSEDLVFVKTKAEDLELGEKADIIVSEWMGYGLLFETMLPSVISVRDRHMKEGGTMWPNKCSMFIEGATDKSPEYWDDIFGVKMAAMGEMERGEKCGEAQVEDVKGEDVVTERFRFWDADLNVVKDEELDFVRPFKITAAGRVDCLVLTFDVDFDPGSKGAKVTLTTAVQAPVTHWHHAVLHLRTPLEAGVVEGSVRVERAMENHRDMDVEVEFKNGGRQRWTLKS